MISYEKQIFFNTYFKNYFAEYFPANMYTINLISDMSQVFELGVCYAVCMRAITDTRCLEEYLKSTKQEAVVTINKVKSNLEKIGMKDIRISTDVYENADSNIYLYLKVMFTMPDEVKEAIYMLDVLNHK